MSQGRLWVVEVWDEIDAAWWPLGKSASPVRSVARQHAREWREKDRQDIDLELKYRAVQYERVEPKRRSR